MENTEIIKALIKFQSEVPKIELNSEVRVALKSGGSYKFKYADLPYVVETIQPTLKSCELAIHFELSEDKIVLHIMHSTGQELISFMPMKLGSNAQENGSLITYYKRYLLTAGLNIVADQDDDANTNTGNKIQEQQPKKLAAQIKKIDLLEGSENYKKVLAALINGYSIDEIKKKYNISESIETLLNDDIQALIDKAHTVKN